MSTTNTTRVALVTGAAERLGRAIALALARAGYNLAVHYRTRSAEAHETARLASELGVQAEVFQANLARRVEAEGLVRQVFARFGRVDVLIANAGSFERTELEQLSEEACRRMFDDNFFATLWTARACGLEMRARGGGTIIAMADVAALRPWSGYLAYNAAKSSVVALVQTLAKDLAPAVRVNAIAPGPILFPPGFPQEAQRREIGRTLLRRAGTPDEIADTVLFLCRNAYITGVVLPVDGGRLLASGDGC